MYCTETSYTFFAHLYSEAGPTPTTDDALGQLPRSPPPPHHWTARLPLAQPLPPVPHQTHTPHILSSMCLPSPTTLRPPSPRPRLSLPLSQSNTSDITLRRARSRHLRHYAEAGPISSLDTLRHYSEAGPISSLPPDPTPPTLL